MTNKKTDSKDKVIFDHLGGTMRAFKNGKEIEGEFQTRRKDKTKRTIELSTNGKDWLVVPYEEEGMVKTDDNYDPELDPNEQNKNIMVSPTGVRITKGYM